MSKFKFDAIKEQVKVVTRALGCTELEAISKMQGTCVRDGNEELLDDLCDYKWTIIEKMDIV